MFHVGMLFCVLAVAVVVGFTLSIGFSFTTPIPVAVFFISGIIFIAAACVRDGIAAALRHQPAVRNDLK